MEEITVSMNGKKKQPRWMINLRERDGAWVCMVVVLALGIAAIGLMAFLNRLPSGSRYTYTTAKDIWYLEESEMQIAAPAAGESN